MKNWLVLSESSFEDQAADELDMMLYLCKDWEKR